MMFPLDIIVGLCERVGIAVVKAPKHPEKLFSWISAIPESGRTGLAVAESTVSVVERFADAPEGAICLITHPDEAHVTDANSDHIVISTDLAPTVIADRIQRRLMNIIQWNDEMAQMLEEGCINQDLLKASEPVLECYVGLSDSTFSHIAHTPNIPALDDYSRFFVEHGYYEQRVVDAIRHSGVMRKWNLQDWTAVENDSNIPGGFPYAHRVIKQQGRYAAHLIMVSPSRIGPEHVFLFNLLAKKVETCLARHWRLENPLEQRYTYFLKEILSTNAYEASNMEERARMHGLSMTGRFELCLADNAWKTMPTEYFAKTVLEEMPECKVAVNNEQVAMLLCVPEEHEDRLDRIESQLRALALKMEVQLGISERFDSLGSAAFALEEARIALRYGHRYSRRYISFDTSDVQAESIFRFRRYFPYFAVDPFARSEKFITKLLASNNPLVRLRAADREKGANDCEILRVYLRSEGRISTVCDAMHMHRNTVTYRLEKIRALVGDDLDDGDMRMYLRMLYLLSD